MSFTAPIFLWTLLGALIPLGIHLWSKREAKTIKIGSVELLRESDSRQSQSLRLSEKRLLALRMLLIATLAFLLAGPQWESRARNQPLAYVVEPSLLNRGSLNAFLDSAASDHPVYLLRKGLTEWGEPHTVPSGNPPPNYWQLVPELDSLGADSIVVFTAAYVQGLRSRRPESSGPIHWVVLDGEPARDTPVLARKIHEGYSILTAQGDPSYTAFRWREADPEAVRRIAYPGRDSLQLGSGPSKGKLPLFDADTLEVAVYHTDSLESEQLYLRASLTALSGYIGQPIRVQGGVGEPDSIPSRTDLLVWLLPDPAPEGAWKTLAYRDSPMAGQLIEQGDCPSCFTLTSRLTAGNMVSGYFGEQLLSLLDPGKPWGDLPDRYDYRQLEAGELAPRRLPMDQDRERVHRAGAEPWLWALLLLLLVTERLFAKYRSQ
ncbi:BatA domain-containing protein [Robiginitalea biformata]|uniref:Aerotolerance regulator N-terminal domain-containing protein n=1 Tax=Robiginitalea biformata (strain ATCC BAA-864 / DSM 15991 / KCTC 12146 / HTCC2501) TaxID=313596 RepID=A4CJL7_ROBBH|nr:BatA domain-containing protein [Robiginitalea biformata]EAR17125.1 hypothetical protein RB2501_09485 [Robiginitalea biformata HTCC2501]